MKARKALPLAIVMLGAIGLSGCDDVSSASESLIGGRMTYEIHCRSYGELDGYLSTRATPRRFLLPATPEIPEEFGSWDFYVWGMCDCAWEGRIGWDEMEKHRIAQDCRYFAMWHGPTLSLPKVGGAIDYPAIPMDEEIELPTDRSEEGLLEWSEVSFRGSSEEFKELAKPMLLKQIEDSIALLEAK